MIVIDEYLAVRVVFAGHDWPEGLPDTEDLMLPASRWWRLLQAIHSPGSGQLSQVLSPLSPADRDSLRFPHPEVLQILDSRPLLDEAAQLGARFRGGWLINETLAAALHNGQSLWFGTDRNIGKLLASAANELGIALNVAA